MAGGPRGFWNSCLMRINHFEIAGRKIGPGEPCFIIVELSCNHEGSIDNAKELIRAAAEAGADAVKLQTYTADTITRDFQHLPHGTMWESTDLYSLYKKAYTPWEWHEELKDLADELELVFFSSPFDETAVDFLVDLGAPALKIASFEVVDTKLLERAASTGLPILMSSGMTSFLELQEAVQVLRGAGCKQLALFQCNSGYPSSFDEANLTTIPVMQKLFNVPVGLSDHIIFADAESTEDVVPHVSALESVRLGDNLIEVHLTMDREQARELHREGRGGFDWAFSRTPPELKKMIDCIRRFETDGEYEYHSDLERDCAARARGAVSFEPSPREIASRSLRPSLWITRAVSKGEKLSFAAGTEKGNFDSLRPSLGLHVRFTGLIENCTATRDLKPGEPVTWEMLT